MSLKLTMFYDSYCPLCVAEVTQLQGLDADNALQFVDIHAEDFSRDWPQIDPDSANRVLHAQRADGTMLYGLDVSAEVWATVGRHRWLKLLRLPVVRWFTDVGYRLFARYRYSISYLLTGQRRCELCSADGGSCPPRNSAAANDQAS